MSIESYLLSRLRVAVEPAGSYGVDIWAAGAGAASFIDVPFIEGTAQLAIAQKMLPPGTVQQYLDAAAKEVLGNKSASLSFSMILAPTGIAANNATASITDSANAQLRLFKAIMGGLRGGNMGSLVATATSASQQTVTAGQGTRFTAGGGAVWVHPTTGIGEFRPLKSVAGDVIQEKIAFSTAPSVGHTIYNTTTCYPTENPDTTLQFVVEGAEADDRWLLRGMIGGFSLELTAEDFWKVTFNLIGASWSNLGAGTLGAATYQNFEPLAGEGDFVAQVAGTTTFNRVHIQQLTIAPQFVYTPVRTYAAGLEGILRFRRKRAVPLFQIDFTTMFEDLTWYTARDARSDYCFLAQKGQAAGNIFAVSIPSAQVTDVQPASEDDNSAHRVTAKSRLDTDATDLTTDIRRAAGRFDWG